MAVITHNTNTAHIMITHTQYTVTHTALINTSNIWVIHFPFFPVRASYCAVVLPKAVSVVGIHQGYQSTDRKHTDVEQASAQPLHCCFYEIHTVI